MDWLPCQGLLLNGGLLSGVGFYHDEDIRDLYISLAYYRYRACEGKFVGICQ